MSFDHDVIIVGSGPAGVSAAFPLVKAGIKVLMLDVGKSSDNSMPKNVDYRSLRTDKKNSSDRSKLLTTDIKSPSSPKLRASTNQYIFSDYRDHYDIDTKNFVLSGSLAAGGLSNAWGAGVSCFDETDLKKFPINASDLQTSYQDIAKRIGVSGTNDDDMSEFYGSDIPLQSPIAISHNSKKLLNRYKKYSKAATLNGISLGKSRIAVLTNDEGKRQSCHHCGLCIWGCAYDSIYSARFDLEALKKYPNFHYRNDLFVTKLESDDNNFYALHAENIKIRAKNVILACGTIGTTKLVLEALKLYDHEINLLTSPVAGFALCMPERIGSTIEDKIFAMGHLSFRIKNDHNTEDYGFGSIFPAGTIPASELINHVPTSYSSSRKIIRNLQPSMLLGNCFLSGDYSSNKIKLTQDNKLHISGSYSPDISDRISEIRKKITRMMMSYGIFMMPGSFKLTKPGEDIHYAGTLPMQKNPKAHELTKEGEVAGLPNVYVVDGSALTSLPAKPHSFTIMANADRIAKNFVNTFLKSTAKNF